jgi:hypothetical protein
VVSEEGHFGLGAGRGLVRGGNGGLRDG